MSFITFLSTFLSSVTFLSPFLSAFLRLSVQRNIYGHAYKWLGESGLVGIWEDGHDKTGFWTTDHKRVVWPGSELADGSVVRITMKEV